VWRCIKCAEANDDDAPRCHKCSTARPAVDPDETSLDGLVDLEKPVPISESNTVSCPTCGQHFKVGREAGSSSRIYRRLDAGLCPACSRAVTPETLLRIPAREGTKVREALLACPYCGKVLGVST
jgi:hypothetical protein